jgi:phosphomannomutase
MDGIKIKLNDIEWILIRTSQTNPEVNLCIEAKNEDRLKDLIAEYTKLIKQV